MEESLERELGQILSAITIVSPAVFTFNGETIQVNPEPISTLPGLPGHPLPSNPLVRDLQSILYARCYSHPFGENVQLIGSSIAPDQNFIQQLSARNHSVSHWEGGWTIYAITTGGQVSLIKGDRQRTAVPGEFITSGVPGLPPQTGGIVSVQVVRESAAAQPGFYFVYGNALSDMWDDYARLRFYFHSSNTIAPELVHYLSLQLNRYQVPFQLKALNDPSMYSRTDAVVLYVAKRYYELCVRIVQRLPGDVLSGLRTQTPLFTRKVVSGVGIAEEPNTGESFGMNRCRLTSEGIIDAWMKGEQTLAGRFEAISRRFQQGGFNLDLPHLSPTSIELSDVAEEVNFSYA